MLTKEISLELVTKSRRCQRRVTARGEHARESHIQISHTHNGLGKRSDTGMSRHGEREKTKTTNGNVFYVVVNDDFRGEGGKEGGEKKMSKSSGEMERISDSLFFSYKHPFAFRWWWFLGDEKGKVERRKEMPALTQHKLSEPCRSWIDSQ